MASRLFLSLFNHGHVDRFVFMRPYPAELSVERKEKSVKIEKKMSLFCGAKFLKGVLNV